MDVITLLQGVAYRYAPDSAPAGEKKILDVITSPRPDAKNTLYVCTKTPLRDGHADVRMAHACGCRVFLCAHDITPGADATVLITEDPDALLGELSARVHGYPARRLTVFGITGTAGKSSVALMLGHVLQKMGKRVALLTSDGLSLAGELTPPAPIVPDAAEMQRALARMVAKGVEFALLELSAYQLTHHAAAAIPFTAVALTNLTPRYIGRDGYASFAEYRHAKERLLCAETPFAILPAGTEVTHAGRALRIGEGGVIWAEDRVPFAVQADRLGASFTLCTKEQKIPVSLPVIGDLAIENAMIATAFALVAGLELPQIATALAEALPKGRMECVCNKQQRQVFIDAAYEPEDLRVALATLRGACTGRLSVLLGSVGARAKERRAPLGRIACEGADFVYLTADDPDTEDPEGICVEMLGGMAEPSRAVIIPDRRMAILRAVREMRPGDVLLLAGKGSDETQLLGGVRLPFCEREIVQEVL